jgi:hypothetical protein
MSVQAKTFNPIRVDKGEFRISINLTALGDRAVDVLSRVKEVGFPKPMLQIFQGVGSAQIWAVIVQESGSYELDDIESLLERWEPMISQLDLGDRNETMLIAGRFKQDSIAA